MGVHISIHVLYIGDILLLRNQSKVVIPAISGCIKLLAIFACLSGFHY